MSVRGGRANIALHPALDGIAETDGEQRQVVALAEDLARWLIGTPADELAPLARVLVQVARGELAVAAEVCRRRPELAAHVAARATAELWAAMRANARAHGVPGADLRIGTWLEEAADGPASGLPRDRAGELEDPASAVLAEASAPELPAGASGPAPLGSGDEDNEESPSTGRAEAEAPAADGAETATSPADPAETAPSPVDLAEAPSPADGADAGSSPADPAETAPSPADSAQAPSPADSAASGASPADRAEAAPSPADGVAVAPSPADGTESGASPADRAEVAPSPADGAAVAPSPADGAAVAPSLDASLPAVDAAPTPGAADAASPSPPGPAAPSPVDPLRSRAVLATFGPAAPDAATLRGWARRAGRSAEAGAEEGLAAMRAVGRLVPGAGWSLSPGSIRRIASADLPRLAEVIARTPELVSLADALGRAEATRAREGPEDGGSEEVIGVTVSGEVPRALPSELALLGDPSTEDLFYARYAERRLVSLELAGAGLDGRDDPDRRGPVIACVDASASMDGEPEWAAKAILIALARRLRRGGRALHVLIFGGRGQRLELRLGRGPSAVDGLLDLLALTFDGGTDYDGPLSRALELLDESRFRKADLLILTDGHAVAAPSVVAAVRAAREERGTRVVSVLIGSTVTHGVGPLSDRVLTVPARVDAGLALGLRGL